MLSVASPLDDISGVDSCRALESEFRGNTSMHHENATSSLANTVVLDEFLHPGAAAIEPTNIKLWSCLTSVLTVSTTVNLK
jgi:hypothetical protein